MRLPYALAAALALLLLAALAWPALAQDAAPCPTLQWQPPAATTDGSALLPEAVTAYRLYRQPPPPPDGPRPGWTLVDTLAVSALPNPAAPTWTPAACAPATCWLVQAVAGDRVSFVSNSYCAPPPATVVITIEAPTGLTVRQE